ncbi:MAG: proline--tRNA ligase [Proteobacteria bacterium]|nr:proline--tRNA ligase [Pseudomonadota bacterium]
MRSSRYFLPVLKEDPSEAQVVSHKLMLRAGMIRQLSAGNYNWLPLGLRVLRNIQQIIREEMDRTGALELIMPTMQPIELWQESGRGGYGAETLKAVDRHERTLIYGPTHEEVITDIFRKNVKSYRELPLNMYQIQWKFRDEIRPRFGVMRGREFLMKDSYSFHTDKASAEETYINMYRAYLRIFSRMGLKAIPVQADTGPIGGDLSHEFQVLAETGESALYYDKAFEALIAADQPDVEAMRKLYSAADEKHDAANCPVKPENLKQGRGIEVGHIFYLGTKYSAAMGAKVLGADGKEVVPEMGCYGIGVSRLAGTIIEASHDKSGIIWPEAVAPFKVGVVNLRQGDEACDRASEEMYKKLETAGVTVLYDDRKESAGAKFATMDLIGLPWQAAFGPRGVTAGTVELKNRKTGEKHEISAEAAMNKIMGK